MSVVKKTRPIRKMGSRMKDATRKTKRQPELPSQPGSRERRFSYAPLNPNKVTIRLVKVLSTRSVDGLIRCSMFNAQLPNEDKRQGHAYCCLSYTWGDQSNKRQIRINGKLHTVAQNLWTFLDALRRRRVSAEKRIGLRYGSDAWLKTLPTSYIWIDALCINQNDKAEKEKQVQRMGQIYKRAVMVLMWLGNDPRVKSAIETLHNSQESLFPSSKYHGTLMNLDYWSRAWIAQEVILPTWRVVFLKSGLYSFLDLGVKMVIGTSAEDEGTAPSQLVSYLLQWNPQSNPKTVLHVLSSLGTSRKCEDNRDQIYSLLAMSNNKDNITVNYRISTAALARQVLIACEASVCLCSMSILLEALELSDESTLYVEMDAPRESCWSESPNKCKNCKEDLSYSSKDKLGSTLCLRTMCSTFRGHIYAFNEDNYSGHPLRTSRSSSLHFTVLELLGERTFAREINGVSIGFNVPGLQDARQTWQFTVRSFMEMTKFAKYSRSEPIKMCHRSKFAKGCDHCAYGEQVDDNAICFFWNEVDEQTLQTAQSIVHRTLSCTLESSGRYGMRFFNKGDRQ